MQLRLSRQKLDIYRAQAGFRNITELAQAAGVKRYSIYKLLSPKARGGMTVETVAKLAAALRSRGVDVRIDDLLEEEEKNIEAPAAM